MFKFFGLLDKQEYTKIEDALLILLDVPTLDRVDGIEEVRYKEIVKIDHHPCEEKVADLEVVDDTSSSTCQLVADFLLTTHLKINEKIASNLFLGIVSDSDRFLLSYTSPETFSIVSRLISEYKIDFVSLYTKLYERPVEEIRFFGYLGEHLELTENGLAYVKISSDTIREYGVDTSTASSMINDFNYIKDVLVWIFITHDDKNNMFKVNIRSRGPIINEITAKYHGGGHKFASGLKTENESDIDHLIEDLDNICKEYKENK